jgi:hypothetical protein
VGRWRIEIAGQPASGAVMHLGSGVAWQGAVMHLGSEGAWQGAVGIWAVGWRGRGQ